MRRNELEKEEEEEDEEEEEEERGRRRKRKIGRCGFSLSLLLLLFIYFFWFVHDQRDAVGGGQAQACEIQHLHGRRLTPGARLDQLQVQRQMGRPRKRKS